MIAPGLGVDMDKIFLVQNPAGGTFGYKFSPTTESLVGAATLATGQPTVLVYDYQQHQCYTGKRSPFFVNVRYAADKDGTLLGMETDWTVDHGPYSEFGDLLTLRGAQFIGSGYNIPVFVVKAVPCVRITAGDPLSVDTAHLRENSAPKC